MKNIIKTTLMMLLAGTIITACNQKTEYPEPNTTATVLPVAPQARVKYMHASPDAPEMKFFINGTPIASGLTTALAFGQDAPYQPFDVTVFASPTAPTNSAPGTASVISRTTRLATTVADATKTLFNYIGLDGVSVPIQSVAFREASGTTLGTNNFTALAGVSYSVFLTDTTTRPANIQSGRSTDIGGPLLNYTIDDTSFLNFATVPTRSTKLRLVHLSPNAPAVKVTIGSQEATSGTVLTATTATPFPSIAYKATAANFTLPVSILTDADNKVVLKNIEVRTVVGNALVLTIPSLSVTMGKAYTLVAVGKVGTASFGVKAIQNN